MSVKAKDAALKSADYLMVGACCAALIPGVGFFVWIVAIPLLFAAAILCLVSLSRGGGGILELIASITIAPAIILVTPVVTKTAAAKLFESSPSLLTKDIVWTPGTEREPLWMPLLAPLPGGPQVDESKRRLLELYPQIGVADSPMNRAYEAAVREAQKSNPDHLISPNWPMIIGSRIELVDQGKDGVKPSPDRVRRRDADGRTQD